jgi:FtsP/CotA-like multicopper oxidase with cupredoxin domain
MDPETEALQISYRECRVSDILIDLTHSCEMYLLTSRSSLAGITVTIPGSEIKVVQVDGGNHVEGSAITDSVGIIYPGERVDIIVDWTKCQDEFSSYLIVALDRE